MPRSRRIGGDYSHVRLDTFFRSVSGAERFAPQNSLILRQPLCVYKSPVLCSPGSSSTLKYDNRKTPAFTYRCWTRESLPACGSIMRDGGERDDRAALQGKGSRHLLQAFVHTHPQLVYGGSDQTRCGPNRVWSK